MCDIFAPGLTKAQGRVQFILLFQWFAWKANPLLPLTALSETNIQFLLIITLLNLR